MATDKRKFLTKERELELGVLIQDSIKAKDELSAAKRLTAAKRENLNKRINDGERALDELIKANLGLVHDRAKTFKSRFPAGPDYEDLVQEGMAGLVVAAKKYDPERGNKFSTVAYYWIAQQVARGANKTGRLVRLPENRINDYMKMNAIISRYEEEDLTPAELDDIIMEELGVSKNDLMNIRSAAATPASLNKVVSSESGNSKELMDFVGETNASVSAEHEVIEYEMRQVLLDEIKSLPEVSRDVLLSSFAINTENTLTPEEVKELYRLPAQKYKKIQSDAVRNLHTRLEQKGLSFSDFTG